MNPQELWEQALEQLRSEFAPAIFIRHLVATQAVGWSEGTLIVAARGTVSAEWLNSEQLRPRIEETLARLCGKPTRVRFQSEFTLAEDGEVAVRVVDFDPLSRGYQIVPAYAVKFWLPLVGPTAFNAYLVLKAWYFSASEWTRPGFVFMRLLATTIGTSQETLVGRRGLRGQIYRLEDEGVARIWVVGQGRAIRYCIVVRNSLPLLTPAQVSRLPAILQDEHRTLLRLAKIDEQEWREQLT